MINGYSLRTPREVLVSRAPQVVLVECVCVVDAGDNGIFQIEQVEKFIFTARDSVAPA